VKKYVQKMIEENKSFFTKEQMKVMLDNMELISKVYKIGINEGINTYLDYINNL